MKSNGILIDTLKAKSNNLTTLVVQDFDDTARKVMDELRVTTFAATIINSSDSAKRTLSAQEKQDFDKLG
jgi:hypothetical protein